MSTVNVFNHYDAAKSIAYIMDVLCGAIKEGLDERKLEKEKEIGRAHV